MRKTLQWWRGPGTKASRKANIKMKTLRGKVTRNSLVPNFHFSSPPPPSLPSSQETLLRESGQAARCAGRSGNYNANFRSFRLSRAKLPRWIAVRPPPPPTSAAGKAADNRNAPPRSPLSNLNLLHFKREQNRPGRSIS